MNITKERNTQKIHFSSIPIGGVFEDEADGGIYMKTPKFGDTPYNAVDLESGVFVDFDASQDVIKVNAELKISY